MTRRFNGTVLCMLAVVGVASPTYGAASNDAARTQPQTKPASQFADQIKRHGFPHADPPAKPTTLQWDFSDKRTYAYGFHQEASTSMDMAAGGNGQTMSLTGRLQVKSQRNGKARLVLDQLQATMTLSGPKGNENKPRQMKRQISPMVLTGMTEDGRVEAGGAPRRMLLKVLFPLPGKRLEVGETAEVPVTMPFNAMGSALTVKGQSRITLAEYVRIDGRRLARLETQIDIDQLKVPDELKGEYHAAAHGQSVFYFDPKQQQFVRGGLALRMDMRIDPMPNAADTQPKEAGMAALPQDEMAMSYDTLITLKPKKAQ